MSYQFQPVTSIEHEISHIKREIDNIEWEGGHCEHLHKHLANLIDRMLQGDVFYPPF